MDKGSCPGCHGIVKGHAESAQWEEEQVRKAWDGGGEKIVYPPPKNSKQELWEQQIQEDGAANATLREAEIISA